MTRRRESFVDVDPFSLPDDVEFIECNFMRTAPDKSGADPVGTRLWPGDDTPRTFIKCNLINCEPPPASNLVRCNTFVVEYGVPDPANDDVVFVDGIEVGRRRHFKRILYGRWNNDLQEFQHLATPREDPYH